jgi:hypothetical protein
LLHAPRTPAGCHGTWPIQANFNAGGGEADVTAVDLLVFGPWLIFGAGMAVIGYLLLRRHGTTRHRRRHNR